MTVIASSPRALRAQAALQLVADGLTSEEIAAELGVSADTVKKDLQRLSAANNARNRPHLVMLGLRARAIR